LSYNQPAGHMSTKNRAPFKERGAFLSKEI